MTTTVIDRIGLLVTKAKILDSLEEGFYYRHEQLRKLLEAP